MEALEFLNRLYPVSEELKEYLLKVFKRQSYTKGSYLLRSGQVCWQTFYLESGMVRWFYESGGKEITSWFVTAGNAILAARSFYEQMPSPDNIQAIADCETIYIEYHELMKVYDLFPDTRTMGRKISDQYHEQIKQYADAMRMSRSEDRYNYLQQQFPDLIYTVDAAYLASFINVDESTFYKLRKRQQGKDGEA